VRLTAHWSDEHTHGEVVMTLPHPAIRLASVCSVLGFIIVPASGCAPGDRGPAEERSTIRRGNDLLAGGRALLIRDSVPGDVIVAGGDIDFTGTAGGDYLGAGGRQVIAGQIDGSVRAAGGEMRLGAAVDRNATLAGGRIELLESAAIAGNGYFAGGEIIVTGAVNGELQVTGGAVELSGSVGEDVHVRAGRLHVGPGATIGGSLRHSIEPANVTIDPGARIAGEVVALPPPPRPSFRVLRLVWHLGFLVAGAAAIALLPRITAAATRTLRRRPGAAVGFGVLWVVGLPIVAGLLAMTIVGIPLALILFAIYAISLYLGRAVVALWLGRLLLGRREQPGRGGLVLSFLLGGVVLVLLGLVPIAGALVAIVATLVGLGAAVLVISSRSPAPE
jgi:hypothetical protein